MSVGGLRVRRDGVTTELTLERARGRFEHGGQTYLLFDELGETPWLCLDRGKLTAAQIEAIERTVDSAPARRGYREVAHVDARAPNDIEALYRDVVAQRPVAGAHVVRSVFGPLIHRPPLPHANFLLANVGAFLLCTGGVALLGLVAFFALSRGVTPVLDGSWFAPLLRAFTALGAALGLLAVLAIHMAWPRGPAGRRLVVAPAGLVLPLEMGPRAFAWAELAPLRIAPSHFSASALSPPTLFTPRRKLEVEDALQVTLADGRFLGEVPRSASKEPLELVAALATHYRAAVV